MTLYKLLFALSFFNIFKLSNAFCIYNNIQSSEGEPTTRFWIRQHPLNAGPNYFSRFANYDLKQGEKACCPYTNTDCVRSGKLDEEIKMVIRRTTGRLEFPPMIVSLPGGGWIELAGGKTPETATINVFNADGSPYDYTYKVDFQAGYQ